jgi:hypothetical protein
MQSPHVGVESLKPKYQVPSSKIKDPTALGSVKVEFDIAAKQVLVSASNQKSLFLLESIWVPQ